MSRCLYYICVISCIPYTVNILQEAIKKGDLWRKMWWKKINVTHAWMNYRYRRGDYSYYSFGFVVIHCTEKGRFQNLSYQLKSHASCPVEICHTSIAIFLEVDSLVSDICWQCYLFLLYQYFIISDKKDYSARPFHSKYHLNRPSLAMWSQLNKSVKIYQSLKGYKAISQALEIIIDLIIYKERKLGKVVKLPRIGQPTKISPRALW